MSRWRDLARAMLAAIGADELLLSVALGLIVAGLWPIVGQRALLLPGLVILWIALPSRHPFVHRLSAPAPKRPQRSA